jgi:hypothetical protein
VTSTAVVNVNALLLISNGRDCGVWPGKSLINLIISTFILFCSMFVTVFLISGRFQYCFSDARRRYDYTIVNVKLCT